jgi:hypothetical protein
VRKGDVARRDQLNEFLLKRSADIDRILSAFGVPRISPIGAHNSLLMPRADRRWS